MLKFIKKYLFEITIFLVVFILCAKNFTPGTFLTGWDNLHPEFNILANIKRSIFSTWQEYQGLGLLAGMAHSTDLVRQLIILPLTIFLPTNLIRYLWHFAMLFLGTYGLFYLSVYITKNKYASLVASLFYLLNFGTVQYFNLPFDPYSTFWGYFPWLILSLFQKDLKRFVIINLLATPSFYVQTLFVVYFVCACFFKDFKKLILIILINSFWLLPNIYFTLTQVSVTQKSMMNLMVTDQFIEQNIFRGDLKSLFMLQGQYYDIKQFSGPTSQFMMQPWHLHFQNPLIIAISTTLILISLLAIFSKNKFKKYFIFILLFCLVGFLCSTPPFSFINELIRQTPVVNQIFRNSFTKLLVPFVFSLSILLGIFLSKYQKISLIFIPFIIILSWPSYQGNFINPKMRVNIPSLYFNLIKYLNTQDSSKRILDLPQYNYWGWDNYTWGAVGSGFLWYGVDQPITSRTFDVWDNHLENFYWQLNYALNKLDPILFENILSKYKISYVLFDDSLFFPEANNTGKVTLNNQKVIDNIKDLVLEKKFGSLSLYAYHPTNNSVYTTSSLPNINISQPYYSLDPAYNIYGNYQTDSSKTIIQQFVFADHPFSNRPNLVSPKPLTQFINWQPCLSNKPNSKVIAVNQETAIFSNCGPDLNLSQNYVIKVTSKNTSGRPFLYKVFSLQDNRLVIDSKLSTTNHPQYIYVPAINSFDQGLGINFSSLSLSNTPSINELVSVEISPTDTNFFQINYPIISNQTSSPVLVDHPNQTFYKITLNNPDPYLILPQSFSPGWLAFYFDNYKIKFLPNHVTINNWANGWSIPSTINDLSSNIYIFFWPQLLEFLGFGLLIGSFIWVIKRR